ncbi:histidine phosphatase family protein [Paenibacillus sp. 19GGS1-52]|uniref:histidine phosphatase family protein n=1 Tax=Paenibacillus sp. 19GGS1-52 TaxID=2758563 RepID=UPI001EFB4479|nr:histidine phosphatase family protein [Paenibacillus sp. 19GGS1-52]ULO06576.1 histidine phosphatase family protein [Paenibacillus sp. 19GGS1-52]
MTTFGLIRHGSTYWNKEGRIQGHTDNSLDEEGLQQAAAIAERLSGEQWDFIYSSDLLRAKQTAEVIATRLGIEITGLVPGIREMSGGLIEGTLETERVERWGSEWKSLELGLESFEAGLLRGSQAIKEIAGKHPGAKILVVSHGAILRSTLKGLIPELDVSEFLKNTSITRITQADDVWHCELYNSVEHLNI